MIYAINPPVWHYPETAKGKIIIAIDRQKTWERVSDYRERVVDLFLSQKMSEKHDQRFMCRVFLGGLRPQILNVLLQNESYFMFKSVSFHAELLELIQRGEGPIEDSDEESDDDDDDGDSGEESGGEDLGVQGVVSICAGSATMADHNGGNNGSAAGSRARPSVTQDGAVYFGEPNKRIDKLYNARYILVLYR